MVGFFYLICLTVIYGSSDAVLDSGVLWLIWAVF